METMKTTARPKLLNERFARILEYLDGQDGPLTPKQIAEGAGVPYRGLGVVLQRMEARGMLTRPYYGLYVIACHSPELPGDYCTTCGTVRTEVA